jgi:hypothetical protein
MVWYDETIRSTFMQNPPRSGPFRRRGFGVHPATSVQVMTPTEST